MIGKMGWRIRQALREIWVRAVSFAFLGVAAALAGVVLAPFIPDTFATQIGADAVDQILGILASSMLAVATFSLSIAVQAYAAASSNATPRATQLLQEDRTTQNVLATFVGAFLFSLVGIIALNADVYSQKGRVVLFVVTVTVVALVAMALLRWIIHLMKFGRVGDTLDRVEEAATEALTTRAESPYLGGKAFHGAAPAGAISVPPTSIGYVQHIDLRALSDCAEEMDAEIWLVDLPGSFAHPGAPLLYVTGASVSDEHSQRLCAAFTVEAMRTFDQDPRFGLIVLSEIASRALSPAVNDPGTAIDVLGRLVRILSNWHPKLGGETLYPRLHVPPIQADDMLEDAFQPIARDGAAVIEVQIRLQKALAALSRLAPDTIGIAARRMSAEALERANAALPVEADKQRLRAAMSNL